MLAAILVTGRAHADATLVFNEVMYHPATNEPLYEWVEFYNQMAVDLDLSGWELKGDIDFKFPVGTRVAGRSYVVLAATPAALTALTGITNVLGPYTGSTTNRLSNNGGELRLHNNAGRLVDRLNYGTSGDWPVAPDGSGAALAKRDRDSGSGESTNWTTSAQIGGTPGAENFPGGSALAINLIPISAAWKYEASGTDLGTGWKESAFNDAAWSARYNLTNRAIPGLFSTGLDAAGAPVADGGSDAHYILSYGAQGTVGAPAVVTLNHSAWLANDASSKWISVVNPGTTSINGGGYGYKTTFSLAGFILSTVQISYSVAIDNAMTNVFFNGVALGSTYAGFAAYSSPFTLTSGFLADTNTLEFGTENQGAGPGAFRAVVTSSGLSANTNSPLPLGRSTYYFRKGFNFNGNPQFTTLSLNPVVADGAVFYLNGVEIHRQNMPTGAVGYATTALTNVTGPNYSGPVNVSAASLVFGSNVLAVEVHQAAGSPDGPLLGAELSYVASAAPAVPLAFNEHNGSSNAVFWLELVNFGAGPLLLDGCMIRADGATNRDYVFPAGSSIPAGGFLVVSNSALGFVPASGDKMYLYSSNRFVVHDSFIARNGPRARLPDGAGEWAVPTTLTPGAANIVAVNSDIVINEIMYHHALAPAASTNLPPQDNPEQWIELFNRGTNTVDLGDWEITGGISYNFPAGRTIAPGAYLVVAGDYSTLHAAYPTIDMVGGFGGRLSGREDTITLRDGLGNVVDKVHYFDKGRWPDYADGGGSTLELRDPRADNSKGEAWAASDESPKTSWQTFSYRMVAAASATPAPDAQWREFVFGLLTGGECWIDDISVIQNPTNSPVQIISNGNFEAGITGWRVLGNHRLSRVETDPLNAGNKALHLISTGPQEHMHNHIEGTLAGAATVANGTLYEISFRARWIGGGNLLNTRLYFNRCARTTALPLPALNGTPGQVNSRSTTNIGPTFDSLVHTPVVPNAGQAVTVSVTAQDPQGVASCTLRYSTDSVNWTNTAMTASNGVYSGVVPGFAANTLVQFYVTATDGVGTAAVFPARGTDSAAFYRVNDSQANVALAHNIRILMSAANTALMHADTNVMSNEVLPATVIYDERIVFYDMGVRLKSSERGRPVSGRVGFHLEFPPDQFFRGAHPVMLIDRSPGGSRPPHEEILLKHMCLRSGVPMVNSDPIRVIAPQSAQTGPAIFAPRYEDDFVESMYDNGGEGTLWELELIYYPTTANAAGYKLPSPDAVQGVDYSNLGNDKETYRYNFIIKNHRGEDDYSQFITFAKQFSLSGSQLEQQTRVTMDIDEWLRAYAMVSLCGVGDMYTFGNNHNFMVYMRPEDGKFLYFPWDMDFSFNNATNSALVGNQNLANIVNQPGNLRRLYAHMLDHINVSFNAAYMNYWLGHYGPFLGQSYTADAAYITGRGEYAKSTIASAFGAASFTANAPASVTASNTIIITGTAPVGVQTITVNGVAYPVTWSSVVNWSMTVPLGVASNGLAIAGLGLDGSTVTNLVRNVDYLGAIPTPVGAVVFNEVMFNPFLPDAGYIELFNNSSNFTFDLSSWRIDGLDFTFPSGSFIGPRRYAVVAASAAAYLGAYGTGAGVPLGEFLSGNLQNNGETLTLLKPGATTNDPAIVVDKIRYDSELPWPTNANGTGSSLQLVDAAQENARVGNWTARYVPAVYSPEVITPARTNDGWRFMAVTGTMGSTPRLLISMDGASTVWVDDISFVSGTNAGVGTNYVFNGDFEQPLSAGPFGTNAWVIVVSNMPDTAIVSDLVHSGSGALKYVPLYNASTVPRMVSQYLYTNSPLGAPLSGQTCTLSFWHWATNTGTNLTVRIQGATGLLATTNINISYTPSNFSPAQLVSPATNYASPGVANQFATNLPVFQNLWINEVLAENLAGITDAFGQREPWIELHNPGTNAVSLDGLYLSTTYTNLTNWAFPAGHSIPAGGFKVVFCDNQPAQTTNNEIHAGVLLTAGGGSIALSRLYNGQPQTLDYVNYSGIHADRSFGSFPDGQPFERMEFYYVTPAGTNDGRSAPLVVFINEWMAGNAAALADPADGNFDDWFEIYNPATNAVDLAGYCLTDNLTNKFQYLITTNGPHIVPPGGHLLVWADNETGQNMSGGVPRPDLHVNFRLNLTGEQIGIFAADGSTVDAVTFGSQTNDVSQGRFPDGSASLYYMPGTATPRAANSIGITPNTAPVLGAIGNKIVYLGHTLAFTATATDADVPAQALTFTLDPGAPLAASISGGGAFTWTPVAAGNFPLTIRVTDNGAPSLDDFETINVEVVNHPGFSGFARNGANFELTWDTRAGRAYRVEFKDDLNASAWTFLQDVVAAGNSLSLTNGALANQRFYRVTVLP